MGGAPGTSAPIHDDSRIKAGEKLWRLLDPSWYKETPPGSGQFSIVLAAFLGEVSLLREVLVNEAHVNSVKNGKFAAWGLIELTEQEIRNVSNCWLVVDADPDWPDEAHVLIYRKN